MHPATPSDVIPMLTASTPRLPSCSPMELAAALRRLHKAGMRRGYVLVVPTHPAGEPGGVVPVGSGRRRAAGGVRWWSRLCALIHAGTGLGVVLADAGHAGLDAERVGAESGRRGGIAVLSDLSRGERSALLEISRGVCTGDPGLLAEARVRGVANCEPPEIDAAVREGRLAALLVRPAPGVRTATA